MDVNGRAAEVRRGGPVFVQLEGVSASMVRKGRCMHERPWGGLLKSAAALHHLSFGYRVSVSGFGVGLRCRTSVSGLGSELPWSSGRHRGPSARGTPPQLAAEVRRGTPPPLIC